MTHPFRIALHTAALTLIMSAAASAQKNKILPVTGPGQAPGSAADSAIPITHHDRVYAAEQFSNTVSVIDPVDNTLLGVIRLGDPQPANMSPLYKGELLVHGMGFSPDHSTLAVVSVGSNSVSFIATSNNSVKHVTYVGRSPAEDAHPGCARSRDANLLAGRKVRVCVLVVHGRNKCHHCY